MATRTIGVILDGVTGRLGTQQHLVASVLAIARDGGLRLADGTALVPVPVLLGRDAGKLRALSAAHGGLRWTTDRAAALADPDSQIYFDASATGGRHDRLMQALRAGKHVYTEKPVASSAGQALDVARQADRAGLRHGVVQDKLFLPGMRKLAALRQSGFFGRIHAARLDFGFWVFDGDIQRTQRSSWNYKRAEGGGIVLDMFTHWRYLTDTLIGRMRAVSCVMATRTPRRRDENGQPYDVDVEDQVLATVELDGGAFMQISNSWATRVRLDDTLQIQVDGSAGSAVVGVHDCWIQPAAATPLTTWHIEDRTRHSTDLRDHWQRLPDVEPVRNGYRAGWEMFLRHVAEGAPFSATLAEGAKALQLIDACYLSARERRWIDLPAGDAAP
ncbi:MAG: Gfo/Idh/MocA family oxidoreductase [Paracoccaceae bacterium]|nr:MAG: Gfo/Idh/MocA family oxidoreductase [Paracoccaceae bacterium]